MHMQRETGKVTIMRRRENPIRMYPQHPIPSDVSPATTTTKHSYNIRHENSCHSTPNDGGRIHEEQIATLLMDLRVMVFLEQTQ